MAFNFSSYIGTTIGLVAGDYSATADASAYAAKTYVTIGRVVEVGEVGAGFADIPVSQLQTGFVNHVNGEQDIGEVPVTIAFDFSDTAQTTVRANAGSNTNFYIKVGDASGRIVYFQAKIGTYKDTARNTTSYAGATITFRGMPPLVRA